MTLDDDLTNQKLTFKVNGNIVDSDYLALAGYSVNFVATNRDSTSNVDLFTGGKTSTTGKDIAVPFTSDEDFDVEIQVIKSGVATISDTGIVKIRNIEAAVNSIESVKFALDTASAGQQYDDTGSTALTGEDFVLNSTKVVAGEEFYVNNVVTKIGTETVIPAKTLVKVETSNPAVISVDNATGIITAEGAGTATLTVKVGDVKKEFTFTVTNQLRKLTTVKPASRSLTIIKGKTGSVKIETLDQYGDPFMVETGDPSATTDITKVEEVVPKNSTGADLISSFQLVTDTADSIGIVNYTVTADEVGSGTLYFKNSDNKVVGSIAIKVTDVDNVGSTKLELVKVPSDLDYSEDATLEISDGGDDKVRYQLTNYTTEGVKVGAQNLADTTNIAGPYKIEVADPTIALVSTTSETVAAGIITAGGTDSFFNVEGQKAGRTDVLVKDKNGKTIAKQTITVTDNPFKVSSVSWKNVSTINYIGKQVKLSDVISITPSENDDIVTGIKLNKQTAHKIRLDVADVEKPLLYIDVNGNGENDAGTDIVLGQLSATIATGATGSNNAGAVTDIIDGTTATELNDKATVIFKFTVDENKDGNYDAHEVLTSTSVTIDVK